MLNHLFLDIGQRGCQVIHGTLHCGKMFVIGLWDLHAILLAEFHDNVEEVHAVEFQLFAERWFVLQVGEVFIGGDIFENIDNFFDNLCVSSRMTNKDFRYFIGSQRVILFRCWIFFMEIKRFSALWRSPIDLKIHQTCPSIGA